MLGFNFKGFNDTQKGYISLVFGILLLLHSLNIFRAWFNGIIVFIAIGCIIYGILQTHITQAIVSFIQRQKKSVKHTTSHSKES